MKKIIAIILVVTFVFTLSACNNKNTVSDTDTSAPISTSSESFIKPENYASVLLVSINPQFKLYLDENNKVLAVEPVNDDAKSFSDSIDFENKTVEAVVGNIVEKANEKGFIKENVNVNFEITEEKDGIDNSDILAKVVSTVNQKASELNIEIKTEIKESDKSQTSDTNSENTQTNENSKPTTTHKPTESSKPVESSKPTHTHSYSDATCTAPAKCSCGATKGSALGHKWQDATCQAPKTCSVCKTIEGNKLKHTYDEDGICSLCKSKDPNFKYPAVSSMDGNWKSVHKQENYLCELTYHFTLNPPKDLLPFGAGEWGYFPEEEIQLENNESLDDYESIVWTDGKTYYKLGGGMVMEGIFEDSDDKVIVTDYYSNNKKMVLQRISTNRMKVISFDSQIEYVNIPIGTILTFCEK